MKQVLVIGRTGQVAAALARMDWGSEVALVCRGREAFDLAHPAELHQALADLRPDLVINAGAYTAVDKAESEPKLAFAINRDGPAALADAAAEIGVPMIQLSTDYVFDGLKSGPYAETDPVHPLSVYGASKEAGECAVRDRLRAHVILRGSWIYSAHGRNFLLTMLRLAQEGREIRVVDDQQGAPTTAAEFARAVTAVGRRLLAGGQDYGTFHFAASGATTWHGFAGAIFARAGLARVRLSAISSAAFAAAARRPANSTLDCRKIAATYGILGRPWPEGLAECLASLAQAGAAQ
jgi:dTDP-4-dehydrorhamnose reductase